MMRRDRQDHARRRGDVPRGTWRFVRALGEGNEIVLHGEYQAVEPVTRLNYTFNQGERRDNEIPAIVDIRAADDGTHATLSNRCTSRAPRDNMVSYGAEPGAAIAWDRLAAPFRRT